MDNEDGNHELPGLHSSNGDEVSKYIQISGILSSVPYNIFFDVEAWSRGFLQLHITHCQTPTRWAVVEPVVAREVQRDGKPPREIHRKTSWMR